MGRSGDGQNKQWCGSNWLANLTESDGNDDETTGYVLGTANEDDDEYTDCDPDTYAFDAYDDKNDHMNTGGTLRQKINLIHI